MKWETSTFIEKAIEIHGNKYDYSRTQVGEYKGGKVKIVCPKHGITLLYYTNNLKRMFFENEKIYHSSDEIISKIQNQETI